MPNTEHRAPAFLRRSRGHAPAPLAVRDGFRRPLLACGGELKNTFCVAKGEHAFLSHHIGDLENYETLRAFREGVEHYCRLFDVQPELVAYDLHPEYLSTRYAAELEEAGLAAVGVQHHHAHVASCLADNERPATERVIGVALDGTGFGSDGAIWGGEFLEGSVEAGFERRGHLEYVALPGGEAAIRQPWRIAIAHLIHCCGEAETLRLPLNVVRQCGERRVRQIARLIEHRLNAPPTSSAGRLFDAVAALAGVPGSWQVTYEGQAAIELELAAAGPTEEGYPFCLRLDPGTTPSGHQVIRSSGHRPGSAAFQVETRPLIAGVVEDLLAGRPAPVVAARFHRTLAEVVAAGCEHLRQAGGGTTVALSGGVFQNELLREQAVALLTQRGFVVYQHRRVPANDGGLCLGQAVLAKGSEVCV